MLLFDDFESGSVASWVVAPAVAWSIAVDGTNVYKQGADSSDATHWITSTRGDPSWTDVSVEAKIKPLSFPSLSGAGVIARFQDDGNFYFAEILSNNTMFIRRRTGTVASASSATVSGPVTVTIALNTWYTVKLVVKGSTLTAYLDGVLTLTGVDTNLTHGTIGVGTYLALAEFDDVRVTTAP